MRSERCGEPHYAEGETWRFGTWTSNRYLVLSLGPPPTTIIPHEGGLVKRPGERRRRGVRDAWRAAPRVPLRWRERAERSPDKIGTSLG